MTHTFATLDVSPACYEEIRQRLKIVDYQHCFQESDGVEVLDMQGIALKRETDERVKVWLLFEGKKV